jgi:hypothetical protein
LGVTGGGPPKAAAPALPPVTPGMIRFACGACGKPMQAKSEYVGQTTRCPSCQSAVVIVDPANETVDASARTFAPPPPQPAFAPAQAPPAYAPAQHDLNFSDEDRPARSRGAQKGGSALPWVLALFMLLMMVGGGVALFMFGLGGGSANAPDLILVPTEAQAVVSVRLADLWNSPLVKDQLKQAGVEQMVSKYQDEFGLAPGDIERVTFVAMDVKTNGQPPTGFAIVQTSKTIDKDKILAAIEKSSANKPKETTFQGKTYYMVSAGGNGAVYFHADKIAVLGSEDDLKKVIENGPRKKDGPLAPVLAKLGNKPQLLVGANLAGKIPFDMLAAGEFKPMMEQFRPLADVQTLSLLVNLSGNNADLEVHARFENDAKAKTAKDIVDQLKGLAGLALPTLKQNAPKEAAAIEKFLASLDIKTVGAEVQIKGKLEDIDKSLKEAMPNIMRLMGGGGVAVADGPEQTAKQKATRLGQVAKAYSVVKGQYPFSLQDLTKPDPVNGNKPWATPDMLIDPWNQRYQFDPKGPHNRGALPDVFTTAPGGKMIGNW